MKRNFQSDNESSLLGHPFLCIYSILLVIDVYTHMRGCREILNAIMVTVAGVG